MKLVGSLFVGLVVFCVLAAACRIAVWIADAAWAGNARALALATCAVFAVVAAGDALLPKGGGR